MLKSEIKRINHKITLLINNKPTSAMAYTTYFEERSACAAFADAGYRIFFVNASFTTLPINSAFTGFSPFRVGIFEDMEHPDYSEFEREVYRILSACPDAVIFPRINVSMPKWWVREHPDDCILTAKGGYREALFSNAFREDGAKLLVRFIRHVKQSDYAHRIGGWQICGGQTQEWFHFDLFGSYGRAAELPYRRWAKEHDGENDAKLPAAECFSYNGIAELIDENAKRYVAFCNEEVAKSIEHFATTIKKETCFEQIVGTFYGYSFECAHGAAVLYGSHALRVLIDSPAVDFFSSPNAYTNSRAFGIDWADMMPVNSIAHHQKLCFMECDIRTHLTRAIQDVRPGEYPDDIYRTKNGKSVWVGPPTREGSLNALRKCFAHQVTKTSAIWWFDMWGGWYNDPLLMQELRALKDIHDTTLTASNPAAHAEVVFFADEEAYANFTCKAPQLKGINDTRTAMGNTGVPYDIFMASDAKEILGHYKAAIFPMPLPSKRGQDAMRLCEKLGIPYLAATAEHPALTLDELCDFYKQNGIHFYSAERDVVYAGNGYVGLHSANAGIKEIKLPQPLCITPIFGSDAKACITDTLTFALGENGTALFAVRIPDDEGSVNIG